jgi:ubiquinone/menaquinone biosynthesis C-methylase UbiE
MNIEKLKYLSGKPELYEKGTSIMWIDSHISKQLLELHINPDNDLASRSSYKIEKTVNWILGKTNSPALTILDLGCGPGLYAEQFARKGHLVTGIDFSENSIRYATKQAEQLHLNIEYSRMDYRELSFENQFDLAIMIYLDFCVLLPEDRDLILKKIHRSLKKDGLFVCDIVNNLNIEDKIIPQSWEVCQNGFWKNEPYLVLNDGFHYPEAHVFANQHIVIDSKEHITRYIFWNHYYEQSDFVSLMESNGFSDIKVCKNVLPGNTTWDGENISFCVSRKQATN